MATLTLPTTEARSRFLSMVKDVDKAFTRYIITHRGKPHAVMMAVDEYEGWLETLEIAHSDSWTRALSRARCEDEAGRRLSYEAVVGPTTSARAPRRKAAARR
ncbi:MAG: type II toxin-antitoxin system Phd/YefM family antitoxin [Elusimicrobia bacterium]|nr:type II toxin-antitoxin system Phd/YefM family antitoxin [Elusimicrobiota bacterium]